MKPEKQRIAIAETCGWTCCGHVDGCVPHGLHPSRSVNDYDFKQVMAMEVPIDDLPDYLNDLNAMNEAVMEKLKAHEMCLADFAENLAKVIQVPSSSLALIIATASQRAEAFLRTIGKWEDDA